MVTVCGRSSFMIEIIIMLLLQFHLFFPYLGTVTSWRLTMNGLLLEGGI